MGESSRRICRVFFAFSWKAAGWKCPAEGLRPRKPQGPCLEWLIKALTMAVKVRSIPFPGLFCASVHVLLSQVLPDNSCFENTERCSRRSLLFFVWGFHSINYMIVNYIFVLGFGYVYWTRSVHLYVVNMKFPFLYGKCFHLCLVTFYYPSSVGRLCFSGILGNVVIVCLELLPQAFYTIFFYRFNNIGIKCLRLINHKLYFHWTDNRNILAV